MNSPELDVFGLAMGLFGGLALFLYGMEKMSGALKAVAGDRLQHLLARLTRNRILGALTGAFVTAVMQSSSVTTVLVVGFITAGLMTLPQSIGVIMGANIGSTITGQIIAFKVTKYALWMVAGGFALLFFGRSRRLRDYGGGLMGLGLVFFGMDVMGDAMAPLRDWAPFVEWMEQMRRPLLGIAAGALFTALIQSSATTTGLVIVIAGQGLLSLPAGIALIFGANIGTCVTALLASIGKPREAVRAALVHVVFNIAGVLVWLPFIDRLAELVTRLSPVDPGLVGAARLAAETPRQIANAHTVFNVVNTILFLGFAASFARAVHWLVPDRPRRAEDAVRARHLDPTLLETPSLALGAVRLEILQIGRHVADMLRAVLPAVLDGGRDELDRVEAMDDAVDALHGEVITYLGEISRRELGESQTDEMINLMEAVNCLESIGDVIETNLVVLGRERIELGVRTSPATRRVLSDFHAAVSRALQASLLASTQKSEDAARRVVGMKAEINHLAENAARHQARRLVAEEPNRLPAYTVETDILQNLKRIYYFVKRMARLTVPAMAP